MLLQDQHQGAPKYIPASKCHCGEVIFLSAGQYACWERCFVCNHQRMIAWSSAQEMAIVSGAQR
jgi:hypothetical protein